MKQFSASVICDWLASLSSAVAACHVTGGGSVVHLTNSINLHLDEKRLLTLTSRSSKPQKRSVSSTFRERFLRGSAVKK